jgi:hypothetical protein
VAEELTEIATVEAGPKREGMTMMMVICPKPGAIKEEKKEKVTEEEHATHEDVGQVEEKTQEST